MLQNITELLTCPVWQFRHTVDATVEAYRRFVAPTDFILQEIQFYIIKLFYGCYLQYNCMGLLSWMGKVDRRRTEKREGQ